MSLLQQKALIRQVGDELRGDPVAARKTGGAAQHKRFSIFLPCFFGPGCGI
jgi:hypothetical protein